jgi:Cof subfamily protein (haloacid dehalogenase superfamily)
VHGRHRGRDRGSDQVTRPRFPILVTDLDGTLVDRSQRISAPNLVAIRRFLARGGRVVLATGRIESSVAPFRDALRLTGPSILYNGARVVDVADWAPLAEWNLPGHALEGVLDAARRVDASIVPIAFGSDRAVSLAQASPFTEDVLTAYARKDGIPVERRPGSRSVSGMALLKILLLVPAVRADELARDLLAGVPGVAVVRSEPSYVEVLAEGVNKGAALGWLLGHWRADGDEVVAVGDSLNDRELLAVAGVGIAVGDGHPSLRAGADVVVGDCDQGAVAQAVAIALGEVVLQHGRGGSISVGFDA